MLTFKRTIEDHQQHIQDEHDKQALTHHHLEVEQAKWSSEHEMTVKKLDQEYECTLDCLANLNDQLNVIGKRQDSVTGEISGICAKQADQTRV